MTEINYDDVFIKTMKEMRPFKTSLKFLDKCLRTVPARMFFRLVLRKLAENNCEKIDFPSAFFPEKPRKVLAVIFTFEEAQQFMSVLFGVIDIKKDSLFDDICKCEEINLALNLQYRCANGRNRDADDYCFSLSNIFIEQGQRTLEKDGEIEEAYFYLVCGEKAVDWKLLIEQYQAEYEEMSKKRKYTEIIPWEVMA